MAETPAVLPVLMGESMKIWGYHTIEIEGDSPERRRLYRRERHKVQGKFPQIWKKTYVLKINSFPRIYGKNIKKSNL